MTERYFGFKDYEDMKKAFTETVYDRKTGKYVDKEIPDFPTDEQVLFADYEQGYYEGEAQVLFVDRDGLLYEVKGSHCSCYGLEGQWAPGLVSWTALAMRPRPAVFKDPAMIALWTLVDRSVA